VATMQNSDDSMQETHTDPEIRGYFEALGQFVTYFSMVESTMQKTLWFFAGVAPPIAPAIFSGTRIEAASSNIKRIADATEWPKDRREIFDELTSQLGEITQTRNDLLHFGAQKIGVGEYQISNALLAHTRARIRITKISPKILNAMAFDLLNIFFQLTFLTSDSPPPELHILSAATLKAVWRYKPDRKSVHSKIP
jgi:hypothetical protein